ncbi:MAG: orotate phosphoribosyltransferase [Candidatus Omnitrophota bacterium]
MKKTSIIEMLDNAGAYLKGHFVLSSGLHSGQYLQCALLLRYPNYAEELCKALARKFKKQKIDVVVGPAYGGIIVAYELARALGVRAIFTERKDGVMMLRRNFKIEKGESVLIAEDVVTTGRSVKDVIRAITPYKPKIVGIASLIDRSSKKYPFGKISFKSLVKISIKAYTQKSCPMCKKKIPLLKPGSRK